MNYFLFPQARSGRGPHGEGDGGGRGQAGQERLRLRQGGQQGELAMHSGLNGG